VSVCAMTAANASSGVGYRVGPEGSLPRQPLILVMIVVYNGRQNLEQTIVSVLGFVKERAAAIGMSKWVHFLGFVAEHEMPDLYRQAVALEMPMYFGPTGLDHRSGHWASKDVVRPSWPDIVRAGSPDYQRAASDWPKR
jgi:hypothetical protein